MDRFTATTSSSFFISPMSIQGDGGLVRTTRASHKANFERPEGLFFPDPEDPPDELHPALVNVTARAGDCHCPVRTADTRGPHLETEGTVSAVYHLALQNTVFPRYQGTSGSVPA